MTVTLAGDESIIAVSQMRLRFFLRQAVTFIRRQAVAFLILSRQDILFEEEISPVQKISLLAPQFQEKMSLLRKTSWKHPLQPGQNYSAAENLPE